MKNSLTKQTIADAVQQYKRDRDPREKLFEFGRCVLHFNPPNPNGLKTDYLWKRILARDGLTDILENYAQVVETKDERTGKKKAVQIRPRFHQLDVVRKLLVKAGEHGAGKRYLIQHSGRGAASRTPSPGSRTS